MLPRIDLDRTGNQSRMLFDEERHQLLIGWNQTTRDYPRDDCLHFLFEAQVERTPEAVAVEFDSQTWTYRELNERANQLAHYLRAQGVGPEVLVGVYMHRSLEMVLALYAILKAGGAYVPLDPDYPAERLAFMLDDARIKILLTQSQFCDQLADYGDCLIVLDQPIEGVSLQSQENPRSGVTSTNLAYVIFTSGSTGRPKGVMNEHRGICNRLRWMVEQFSVASDDRVLQKTPFSFDVSVWEFFWPLAVGARLVVARPDGHRDSAYLAELIQQSAITMIHFVPPMLRIFLENADLQQCGTLKRVFCSGEALTYNLQCLFFEHFNCELHNLYGPTEAAVEVTHWACDPHSCEPVVPIGRPLANTCLYALDEQLEPTPLGIPGELHIGGVQVARGYLNRPELTAEKFIADPFSSEAGARLYKTGDLVRWRSDGTLEFLGRMDQQVKIRGFRIELEEIEAVLEEHPFVKAAVVWPRELAGEKQLIGYVVVEPGQNLQIAELRRFLESKLPDYMVPSLYVELDTLPLSPNGKVDRRALPEPGSDRPELDVGFAEPRTPQEKTLAAIWQEVLGIDRVGLHDNFFELGGHSLLATQVISRIRSALRISLPITTFFAAPTINDLSSVIDKLGFSEPECHIEPITAKNENVLLSFGQQRMWFHEKYEAANCATYNILLAYDLNGVLDSLLLERCLSGIIDRHEILRTTYDDVGEGPRQSVQPSTAFKLQRTCLSDLPVMSRISETQRWATLDARQPFDLREGPLLRARLLEYSETDHALILVIHHIAFDGWSEGVLFHELDALYRAYSAGQASPLVDLPIQYADFAMWQRNWLVGDHLDTQLAYWKSQLTGCPELLGLPTDHIRPSRQSFNGRLLAGRLPVSLSQSLKEIAGREEATMYMTLLAAFNVLLSRYSRSEDIVVGAALANRQLAEVESLIGFFVNSIPLRTNLNGNPTFRELLGRVREMTLDAYANQNVPFEQLVSAILPGRDSSHATLFQVMFVLQNAIQGKIKLADLKIRRLPVDSGTAKMDLIVTVCDELDGLEIWFEYNTDIFEAATIERMMGHFQELLSGIVRDLDVRISQLPLITERERHQLLFEWNRPRCEYPCSATLQQLFEAQANTRPNQIALTDEFGHWDYQQLNQWANQLAHYLVSLGVGRGTLVGVCFERSAEMIASLLGILKAGGAYVPFDPSLPQDRLTLIMEDTHVPVIITNQGMAQKFSDFPGRLMLLDQEKGRINACQSENIDSCSSADDIAYVLYTSGSTGRPKGVCIPHRSVVRLVMNTNYVALSPDEVFLQFAPLSFDASTFEIWAPLLNGGHLVIFQPGLLSLEKLCQSIQANAVSTLWLTAGLFHQLEERHFRSLTGMRQLLVGGDVVSPRQARMALSLLPNCRLINGYGPTENTTFTTCFTMDAADQVGDTVSIGRPISNTQVYVLDQYDQLVPIGVAGQLCTGGDGVARGYLNRPELTAEKFIADPFSSEAGARLYKTGDLVRWRSDGTLEFLGRMDQQVKIRGFRIELEEIEAVLEEHPFVKAAVVWPRELAGEKQLIGYVVVEPGQNLQIAELRRFLESKLPDYMVPSLYVELDTLPLSPNGKVDRRALPEPGSDRPELDVGFAEPRTPQEKTLAAIWQEVLGIDRVGLHDNFFELGGHSLLVLKLARHIRSQFGKHTAIAHLFEHQTIASQIRFLSEVVATDESPHVVTIREGSETPLIVMPGLDDHPSSYRWLTQYLPPAVSILAIDPRNFSETFFLDQPRTIEAIAVKCIQQIKESHLAEPYKFLGYSYGGVLAYEVARQLEQVGKQVQFLGLIDAGPFELSFRNLWNFFPDVRHFGVNVPRWFGDQLHQGTLWARIGKEFSWHIKSLGGKLLPRVENPREYLTDRCEVRAIPRFLQGESEEELRISLRNYDAFQRYVPQEYKGIVTLFRARVHPLFHSFAPDLGWSEVGVGGLDVRIVPGNHLSMLHEPNCQQLAQEIQSALLGSRKSQTKVDLGLREASSPQRRPCIQTETLP
jgi:amino acid adenylation domain-containing protein